MSRTPGDAQILLVLLSLCNAVVFLVGLIMAAFASEGPGGTETALSRLVWAVPMLAIACPVLAWTNSWPFDTPLRRLLTMCVPAIYIAAIVAFMYVGVQLERAQLEH